MHGCTNSGFWCLQQMPGFWKILYKHKASLSMLPRNLHTSITCTSKRFLISALLNLDISHSIMNWGKTNWKFLFISLTWKQNNSCFHSRNSCLKLLSSLMQTFAVCPGHPWLPPLSYHVLLELPILLLQALGLSFLVEMVKGTFWLGKIPAGWWETKWLQ